MVLLSGSCTFPAVLDSVYTQRSNWPKTAKGAGCCHKNARTVSRDQTSADRISGNHQAPTVTCFHNKIRLFAARRSAWLNFEKSYYQRRQHFLSNSNWYIQQQSYDREVLINVFITFLSEAKPCALGKRNFQVLVNSIINKRQQNAATYGCLKTK